MWILLSLDRLLMEVHTELDSLVEHVLWLIRSVNISDVLGFHVLLFVVNDSVNNSVSNGLCYDLFSFFMRLEGELLSDVSNGDLAVGDVDLLETELDDGVLESEDQGIVFVSHEERLVLSDDLLEVVHISLLDTSDDFEIGLKGLLIFWVLEDQPGWDFSHEELTNNKQFLNLDSEALGSNLWPSSQRVDKSSLSLTIFQLNSLDSSKIVKISSKLVV